MHVSSERRLLDLESEVIRGLGSISTGGNTLLLDFLFSQSKDENANIGISKKVFAFAFTFTRSEHSLRLT